MYVASGARLYRVEDVAFIDTELVKLTLCSFALTGKARTFVVDWAVDELIRIVIPRLFASSTTRWVEVEVRKDNLEEVNLP